MFAGPIVGSGRPRSMGQSMQPPIRLWGVDARLHLLTGGHRNLAYRTRGLHRDYVFKSTRRPPEAIEWLVPVHTAARECGFVVPFLLRSHLGNLVEQGWTCETCLEGTAFAMADMPSLLPALARFHALCQSVPQRPGFQSSQDLLQATTGGDVDLCQMPPDVVTICRAAWQAVGQGKLSVVHGDLNPSNLLRLRDGSVARLDWDECRRDLVLFDLGQVTPATPVQRCALLAWEVACSWKIEPLYAQQGVTRLRQALG